MMRNSSRICYYALLLSIFAPFSYKHQLEVLKFNFVRILGPSNFYMQVLLSQLFLACPSQNTYGNWNMVACPSQNTYGNWNMVATVFSIVPYFSLWAIVIIEVITDSIVLHLMGTECSNQNFNLSFLNLQPVRLAGSSQRWLELEHLAGGDRGRSASCAGD